MKKIFALILLLALGFDTFSQNYYEEATACFNAGNYSGAVENYEKFLSELTENDEGETFDYAKILVLQSDAYLQLGNYKKAAEICLKSEDIMKKCGEEKSDFYLKSLLNAAQSYAATQDLQKAATFFTESLPLIEKFSGKEKLYADICKNIGYLYFNVEDYEGAVLYLEKAKDIYSNTSHYDYDGYADCVENLATAYFRLGDEQNTLKYTLDYLEIAKNKHGERSPEYLNAVMNCGVGYLNEGNYQKAEELLIAAEEGFKEVYGTQHTGYIRAVYDLSQIYFATEDYYNSIAYAKIYESVVESKEGTNSVEYAKAAAFLSSAYCEIFDWGNAVSYGQKAEKILEQSKDKDEGWYYLAVASLSSAYNNLNDPKKTLEYNNKLVGFLESGSHSDPKQYVKQIKNLAIKYSNSANFDKALDCFDKALEICGKVYGENHSEYINILTDISRTYLLTHNLDKAKSYAFKSYKLCNANAANKNTYTQANVLNTLAEICLELGTYSDALNYSLKAVPVLEATVGQSSVKYLKALTTAGRAYKNLDSAAKAEEYYLKAYTSAKNFSSDKLFIANITNYLAEVYFSQRDYQTAFKYFYEAYTIYESELKNKFSFMTAVERENYWKFFSVVFDNLLAVALTVQNGEALSGAYNSLLISKGLLLASELQLTNLILNSGDKALIQKFNTLKDLHRKISSLSNQDVVKRDSLIVLARQYEADLVNESSQYGDIINYIKVDVNQVREALDENDVAVEFFYTGKTFGALVMKKSFSSPELVILNYTDYENPYTTTDMYNDIWKPLEKYFSADGKIYFSPAGRLHTLAIEYAPIDKKNIISDKYKFFRISSTRNLVLKRGASDNISAVLFGGVAYDVDLEKMEEESQKYASMERAVKKSAGAELFSGGVNAIYLKGTLKEVNNIKAFMDSSKVQSEIHTGTEATEECFKSLSGKGFTIIHIATHGFYLDNSDLNDNSLLYSGLLMAGCNNTETPEGVDDGILTAQEISFMDLRKTDLVVLSACETGLGKVSSEGVFGLQRGFKKTGVNTIIMSLWPVNDYATQLLMTGFYKNLAGGMSKHDAFIASQKNLRGVKDVTYKHWAAFIMLDGDK